ncbi:MAG: flavodoxin family protein [Spirochaetales bacterium]|nr:flavodoxin family protein [Spirochaetales bacterium]
MVVLDRSTGINYQLYVIMVNILGVVGSPRKKGNTSLVVRQVLKGAEEKGASQRILFLGDVIIRECDGCHRCWKGKECSKVDDMNRIYQIINKSNIIVFGTPVYWYGPTALMKAFIDRFVYFNCPENRKKIREKSAVLVIPFEEENPAAADLVVSFFEKSLHYLEMKLAGKICIPGVTKPGEAGKNKAIMDKAYMLGCEAVQKADSKGNIRNVL